MRAGPGRFVPNPKAIADLANDDPGAKAVLKACLSVERVAKDLAPYKHGNLQSSIGHDVSRDNGKVRGTVGSNVQYAIYQEVGTWKMDAQPYLIPALEQIIGQS